MTKQEYLAQVANLNRTIEKKRARVKEYRDLASSPASTAPSGTRVDRTRSTEAPFAKWVYKIVELEAEIEKLQERVDNLQAVIIGAIEALDNEDYKTLLVYRYLKDMSWESVAEAMFISRWTAMRWHKEAISLLELPI